MYREEIDLPARLVARFALPVASLLLLLAAALTLPPLPAPVRIIIGAVGGCYIVAAVVFLAFRSRLRVALDADALSVGGRFLLARRFPLAEIAACTPIAGPVLWPGRAGWGDAYRSRPSGGQAVLLRLAAGARVAIPSADPATLCAALRAARPAIAEAAADAPAGRPSWDAPPGSWRAAAEAESRGWLVRCPRCGHQQSAWDWGWTIWKGAGRSRKYLRCPACGKRGWHIVARQRAAERPP